MIDTKQSNYAWGRPAMDSFSMRYCEHANLAEQASGIQIGEAATLVSVGKLSPLTIYRGKPALMLTLTESNGYVGFQACLSLLQFFPDKEAPIIKEIAELCPKLYNDLMETLCIMWDFSEEDAPEVFKQKNQYICGILEEIEKHYKELDVERLQAELNSTERHQYPFESVIQQLLDDYKVSKNTDLLREIFWVPFLTRQSRAGSTTVLMDGMPFVLSEGEYLFVAPKFDDYIDTCYHKSGLDLEQPFFEHLTFPLSTPSKTRLGDTEIMQSQFWAEGTIGGRRTKV